MQHAWRYPAGIVLGLLLCGSCRAAARETIPADAATGAQGAWLKHAVASLAAMPDTDALVTAAVLARQLPDGQADPSTCSTGQSRRRRRPRISACSTSPPAAGKPVAMR